MIKSLDSGLGIALTSKWSPISPRYESYRMKMRLGVIKRKWDLAAIDNTSNNNSKRSSRNQNLQKWSRDVQVPLFLAYHLAVPLRHCPVCAKM